MNVALTSKTLRVDLMSLDCASRLHRRAARRRSRRRLERSCPRIARSRMSMRGVPFVAGSTLMTTKLGRMAKRRKSATKPVTSAPWAAFHATVDGGIVHRQMYDLGRIFIVSHAPFQLLG